MSNISIKLIATGIIGFIAGLIGGWDMVLEILCILIVVDYLTGLGVALKEKKLNSSIGFLGILKKAMIFLVLILAAQLDRITNNQANLFRTATALFYISNEGISILENIGNIGVSLPPFIVKVLEQLRENSSKGIIDDMKEKVREEGEI
ncbi:phage holin family protein [Clostridium sp. D2Q-11]|uniref:Phage holin family protein n=1 Tax=Anaeromonas frigoriresistens TaxID=2683708 RepID=A0A942Z8P7_9FIRM|nr:phage holin family protein [Anaeromonas frigoriresistens]MBS4538224.1 phage holin family protein [Anaeromonas frigoriresistens]